MPWGDSYLRRLEEFAGAEYPTLRAGYERSEERLTYLGHLVRDEVPDEASFVVFGSLGRKEYLEGSDLDWCLLINGKTDARHRLIEQQLKAKLQRDGTFPNPSAVGAFGALVFGHEMIHCIGGNTDTNANITRRLLLLLESAEVPKKPEVSARQAVLRGVLQRYFEEEAHFAGKKFFPRFFLNDVVRYWRTMAVDYAAKNSERGDEGWALRNVKLRFSRKLLFVAGLLLAYETQLFPDSELAGSGADRQLSFFDPGRPEFSSTQHCFHAAQLTPLELLARACVKLNVQTDAARELFRCYDQFLQLLQADRVRLRTLSFEEATEDPAFARAQALGHDFQEALNHIFLARGTPLGELTLKYGIF